MQLTVSVLRIRSALSFSANAFASALFEHEKVEARLGEGVIHDGVVLVAFQIGVGVVPVFADDRAFGLDFFHRVAEFPPESVRNLVGNVQPPAVDIVLLQPVQPHADEVFLHRLVGGVPFRHIIARGETLVIDFFAVDLVAVYDEPIEIGRIFSLFRDVGKLSAPRADVVEHRVHHHAHPPFVGARHEFSDILFVAEHAVHGKIILDIVFMIAHRPEKRREINCVRAEPRDIAEIFRNAPQIAPRVTFRSGNGTPLQIDISVVLIEIPARETVDEDLIKTRVFHPTLPVCERRRH